MRVSFKSVHKFVTETHCKLKRLDLNERRLDLIKKLSKADYGLGIIALLEHPTLAVSIRGANLGHLLQQPKEIIVAHSENICILFSGWGGSEGK